MTLVALSRLTICCLVLMSFARQISQAAPPRVNRSLARQLGRSSEGAEALVWLSVPPQSESLLGAVVTPADKGFEVVDRLPKEQFQINEAWKAEGRVGDAVTPAAESPLAHSFLKGINRPEKAYLGAFEASDVTLQVVAPMMPDTIRDFVANSKPALEAARAGKRLYFVRSAYTGELQIILSFKDRLSGRITSALPDFKLELPTPDANEAELKSERPIEFAYQMDVVDLDFSIRAAPKVELTPSPPPLTHSKWEMEPRPMAAMAAPNHEPDEKFYRVPVFYASDRYFGDPAPEHARKSFWLCFGSYFLSGSGWALLGITAAVCLVGWGVACWYAGKVRIGLGLVILLIGIVTVGGIGATIYAFQNYQQTIALRGPLTYGRCEVSIPRNHQVGFIEQPVSHFLIRFEPEDPEKHFVVLDRTELADQPFFQALDTRLDQSPERECFVFVHGYNNTFDDAAKRTAQLWYDLQFPGAPIFFSWPSQGNRAGYTFDETNAEWAQEDFEKFLWDLHTRSSVKRIHVIAHSMGNRIVARTLDAFSTRGVLAGDACKLREIVLAAPDIDADTFKTRIAPRFTRHKPHVTLYASKNDDALKASWEFHDYPRAGDPTKGIVIVEGMDSIDASLLDTNLDTHSYFAAQQTVVSDLRSMIVKGMKPAERGLEEATLEKQKYWVFKPKVVP